MAEKILSAKRLKEKNVKLATLSPDKYGKGAFCELTFTPSKLSENIIFREATNLKRL